MTANSGNGDGKKAKGAERDFVPVNDLEKKLARIGGGRTTFLKAFNFLMNSMVVLLVKPPADETKKSRPLVLKSPEGEPLLAMFSSPGRAAETRARHRAYSLAVKMPGWQAVSALPENRGLVVNPGSRVGFTLPPAELQVLRKKLRLAPPPP